MSLTAGLSIAKSALAAFSAETAVVSRNVASAGEDGYVRREANVITQASGGTRVVSVGRAADRALLERLLSVSSGAAGQEAVLDSLNTLQRIIDDPEFGQSPAALVGDFQNALLLYADAPHDLVRASAAIRSANDLVEALNNASDTVQQVRQTADADMAASVDRINSILAQFEEVNSAIISGDNKSLEYSDQLDLRDRLLQQLSQEMGIRTVRRTDDDIAIFTDGGVTLFEKTARDVSFQATEIYTPGTVGNAVYVDGVAVTGDNAVMPMRAGRLEGLAAVRDDHAVTFQMQLDEIARGLIEAFAEQDQSAVPALPDAAGLFTYAGGPAVPPAGTAITGLASQIVVNANVDPAQGGDIQLLRDGAISNPGNAAYVYNSTGAAGFSDRLQQLVDALSQSRTFDPAAGALTDTSVSGFAGSSVSWLEETRRTADADASYQVAVRERASLALSHKTGVNVDEELSMLLELERSYEASARLMSAIDAMYAALLDAAR